MNNANFHRQIYRQKTPSASPKIPAAKTKICCFSITYTAIAAILSIIFNKT